MQKYIKEPFPALSHLVGFLLSIAGLMSLIKASGNNDSMLVVSGVYGASLILLYLASTLNHGIHCSAKTAHLLEQLDYCAIFLLIAGTYTPVCFLMIKGTLGWVMLGTEWTLAIIGIFTVMYGGLFSKMNHVTVYLLMGWLFILAIVPITYNVPVSFLPWLIAGALFYSFGSIIFILDSRSKWNWHIDGHNLWHLCVLSGSVCHFIVINHLTGLGVGGN